MSFIVKNTTFPSVFDLLFPHSCRGCGLIGEVLCKRCKNNIISSHQNICPNCKKAKTTAKCKNCKELPPIYVVGSRNDILGEIIHDYKYNSVRSLARPLAEILNSILPKPLKKDTVFVPLPTASHHIRNRGFDHIKLIVKYLCKLRHQKTEPALLRAKNTVQVGTDRVKRISQAKNAYTINPKFKAKKELTYVLVDDVWTTGASINAAVEILKKAGVKKIIVLLLAYSS